MTLGAKLTSGVVTMAALLLAVTGLGVGSVARLGSGLDAAVHGTARKLELAGALRDGFHEMQSEARGFQIGLVIRLLDGKGAHGCAGCHDSAMIERGYGRFAAAGERVRAASREWRSLAGAGEEERVAEIEAGVADWTSQYQRYRRLAEAGAYAEAHSLLLERIAPLIERIGATAQAMQAAQHAELERVRAAARQDVASTRLRALLLAVMALCVGVAVWLLTRRGMRGLKRIAGVLGGAADRVAGSSRVVLSASEGAARGARSQSEGLSEAADGGRRIAGHTRENAAQSQALARGVAAVQARFAESAELAEATRAAMDRIDDSAARIGGVLKLIDEIAFQTNLLALNASVEAARAAEHGQGFAVIATEVRELAQRCSEAARQTGGLVEEAVGRAAEGRDCVSRLAGQIERLQAESRLMRESVESVAVASHAQAEHVESVRNTLERVRQDAIQAESGAASGSQASAALSSDAAELSRMVEQLTALVGRDLPG